MRPHPQRLHRSRGFVLIVTLVFLIILTIMALGISRRTLLQERGAGGERDHAIALQAAEMALRDAERDVLGIDYLNRTCTPGVYAYCRPDLDGRAPVDDYSPTLIGAASRFDGNCTNGQCGASAAAPVNNNPADLTWIGFTNSVAYGTYTGATWTTIGPDGNTIARPPRYSLQLFVINPTGASEKAYLRITAWGYGATGANPVVLQEVFYPYEGN